MLREMDELINTSLRHGGQSVRCVETVSTVFVIRAASHRAEARC
jgi:hypothetical protein